MSNQIVISSGAKVRALEGVLTGTAGIVNALSINVPNGIPQLDGSGKILVSQLPNSVMEYKGTWNAATNTPTLVNGTGNQGDVYLCNVAGTVDFGAGPIVFFVGDQVIYSGTIWQRASGASGTVTSVAVTETGDALTITGSPITTSGTINIGFAGNSGQYVNGAGGLTTFPSLTGYVPYTGATTNVDLGTYSLLANSINALGSGTLGGTIALKQNGQVIATTGYAYIGSESAGKLNIYFGDTGLQAAILDNSLLTADRTFTLPDASGTLALTSDIPSLTGYVPYTGATANVNLGTFDLTADVITGATGSFASNGGSNTFAINHSSGSGIALNITKGGSGEGLYINKTSGSGNAATIIGTLNATTLVKSGGTSSQYLMADGSTSTLTNPVTGTGLNGAIPKFTTTGSTIGSSIIFDSGTQIGINTLSPSFTLDVNGTARVNGVLTLSSTISNGTHTYTLPSATGTLALTSQLTNGTVTSVGLSSATSGVTIGSTPITTSGTITLAIATASGSQNGLLSSTDWTTFNNKQSALTNPVTGTGTTNYLPKFTGASTIGNSIVQDDGSSVTIGGVLQSFNASPIYLFSTATTSNYEVLAIDKSATDARIRVYKSGTGSYRNLIFETGGSTRLTLDASGNLGLGNTPVDLYTGYKLQIGSSSDSQTFLSIGNSTTGLGPLNGLVIGNDSTGADIYQRENAPLRFHTNNTQAMTLTASGKLLINKTNEETYQLDVNGTGRFVGSASSILYIEGNSGNSKNIFFKSTGAADNSIRLYQDGGTNNFIIATGDGTVAPTNRLTIASTGAATFSSSVTATGALSAYGLVYKNPSATTIGALYTTGGGAGQFYLYDASGTEKVLINTIGNTIFNGGNVGIGSASPSGKLHLSSTSDTYFVMTGGASPRTYSWLVDATNLRLFSGVGATTLLTIASTGAATFSSSVTAGGSITTSKSQASQTDINVTNTSTSNGAIAQVSAITSGSSQIDMVAFGSGSTGTLYGITKANLKVIRDNSLTAQSNGLAIGTDAAVPFYVFTNSTERMRISSAGVVTIANLAGTGSRAVLADANGLLSAPVSDISVKENIKPIGYGLSEILKMNPVWFDFIDEYKNYGEGRQNGMIAQEVSEVIPEAVFVTPSTGKMGINYDQMHGVYIKAIQELKLEIEELKALINK